MKIVISIFAVILLASCGASENTEEAEQSEKVTETTELTETEEPEEVAVSEQTDETEEESEKPAETPLEDSILEIYAHLNTVDKFEEEQFVEGERDMGVINYMDRANGRRAIEALDEVQYYVFPAEDGGQNQYTDTMLDYEGGHILQLGVDGYYDAELQRTTELVNNRFLFDYLENAFYIGSGFIDEPPAIDQILNVEQLDETTIQADLADEYVSNLSFMSFINEFMEGHGTVQLSLEADTENQILTFREVIELNEGVTEADLTDIAYPYEDIMISILRESSKELPPEENFEVITEEEFNGIIQDVGLP